MGQSQEKKGPFTGRPVNLGALAQDNNFSQIDGCWHPGHLPVSQSV
jgi:hypothetical protein